MRAVGCWRRRLAAAARADEIDFRLRWLWRAAASFTASAAKSVAPATSPSGAVLARHTLHRRQGKSVPGRARRPRILPSGHAEWSFRRATEGEVLVFQPDAMAQQLEFGEAIAYPCFALLGRRAGRTFAQPVLAEVAVFV